MFILYLILLSTVSVGLIALIGAFFLLMKEALLKKILPFFVYLSIGALMGGAFLHLIPEAIERLGGDAIFFYVLTGFILFFLIEKIIHWRHCHEGDCPIHTFTYMNLLGDSIHNFIDGLIIAASFIADINLGITTTLAITMHEIPQEIGDLGVLIYGGFKKTKALLFNFLTALLAVLGGLLGFFLSNYIENSTGFLLSFAAGGFIYIAASDLIPEIRKETSLKKSLLGIIVLVVGVFIIYLVK